MDSWPSARVTGTLSPLGGDEARGLMVHGGDVSSPALYKEEPECLRQEPLRLQGRREQLQGNYQEGKLLK